MYNEEIKRLYVNNIKVKAPEHFICKSFIRSGEIEKEIGKDLYDFDCSEIKNLYKTFKIKTLEMMKLVHSIFSKYVNWCIENEYSSNCNNYYKLTLDDLYECIDKEKFMSSVVSREKVLEWCDMLFNPRERFILLGLFEGLKGKNYRDFTTLHQKDIDGNTITLNDGKRVIEVSDELIQIIVDNIFTYTYFDSDGDVKDNLVLVDNDGYILKNHITAQYDDLERKGRRVSNSFTKFMYRLIGENSISTTDIVNSGKVHFIKCRAKELNITPEEYIWSDYSKEINVRFNCVFTRSVFWKKYQMFLTP